jgi:hypothetical protein
MGVVSSEINHLVLSSENRRTLHADEKNVVMIPDHREDPEATVIRKSEEHKFLAHLERKKPTLRKLAESMLYGGTANLNLSGTGLESLKRALRRATEEYLEEGAQPARGPLLKSKLS